MRPGTYFSKFKELYKCRKYFCRQLGLSFIENSLRSMINVPLKCCAKEIETRGIDSSTISLQSIKILSWSTVSLRTHRLPWIGQESSWSSKENYKAKTGKGETQENETGHCQHVWELCNSAMGLWEISQRNKSEVYAHIHRAWRLFPWNTNVNVCF